MKKILIILSVFVAIVLLPNKVQAQLNFILDTGVPTDSNNFSLGTPYGASDPIFLSVNFSLDSQMDINDVYGWLIPSHILDNAYLTFSIYGDNAGLPPVPGTSPALYSADILFNEDYEISYFNENGGLLGWHGFSGLDWNLNSGNYWLVLETAAYSDFDGIMPRGAPNSGPNSAEGYAYRFIPETGNNWLRYDVADLGFRIAGEPSNAVPEPATLFLFGTGLAGIIFKKKKV